MAYAPALVVEGTPRQALPYGLFSVLTPRTNGDVHWQNGITWETLTCAPASGIGDPFCEGTEGREGDSITGLPKVFGGAGENGEATPFTIYHSYVCSPIGHNMEYAQQRAAEALAAREEARVEQALYTGDLDNGGFASGATAVGSSTSVVDGVAALEAWIAIEYGSVGVMHMPRDLAVKGISEEVLKVTGSGLFTVLGTPVVAGAGYPLGNLIHVTPPLLGYRSEVFYGSTPPEAGLDTSTNDLYAAAERTYVIGYDPCGVGAFTITSPPG